MSALKLVKPAKPKPPPGSSNDWFTPMDLFWPLHAEFGFTCDVAPHDESPVTRKLACRITPGINALLATWGGWSYHEHVWCNPPFSECGKWVEKAFDEIRSKVGPELIVQLLPANRTDQAWWAEYVEPHRERPRPRKGFTLRTRFLPGRVQFGWPGNPTGKGGHWSRFGLVILIWRRVG